MSPAYLLLTAIGVLHVIDIALTTVGLKAGLEEANPLWRGLFKRFGVPPVGGFATLLLSIPFLLIVHWYPHRVSTLIVLAGYALSLVWVVWHNFKEVESA